MTRPHSLLYLSSLTEGVAMSLIMFLIPLNMRSAFGEKRFIVIASSVAIPAISAFLANNFWGGLSDLKRRLKPFLIVGLIGYTICLTLLGLVNDSQSVIIVVALTPLIYGALRPTSQSYITLSRESEKGKAIGDLFSFQSFGWLLASIACWKLYRIDAASHIRWILFGGAGLAVFAAAAVAFFLDDIVVPREKTHNSGLVSSIREDLTVLYNSRKILVVCVVTFLAQIGNFAFFSLYSMYFTEYIRGPQNLLWFALGGSTIFGMIFYSIAGRLADSIGGRKTLFLSVVLYLLSYTLMGSTTNPLLLSIYYTLPVYPFINVANTSLVAELSGTGRRTGGMGILNGTFSFSVAAGALLGGIVADGSGLAYLPVVAISLLLLATVFTYYTVIGPSWERAK
ncbi:MAG: MFS transporter [Candidatus Eisenbacteria bacterium]|nr:MFS transporter [Candidatus Eisenbacteria bacterium]